MGKYNTGNNNTGYHNTGDCNTGYWNTGNCNTGYRNTGNGNTGDCNAGYWNTGNCNIGYWNTGNWNTGCRNTGYCNTGNCSTGDWNSCDRSTGFFNTKERTINIFNKDSGLTFDECRKCEWYSALYSVPFTLTRWISYTEAEKKDSIFRRSIGGYLKCYTFYEACAIWWKEMSDENKALVQTMPNFDKNIFKEITGIDVEEYMSKKGETL